MLLSFLTFYSICIGSPVLVTLRDPKRAGQYRRVLCRVKSYRSVGVEGSRIKVLPTVLSLHVVD